MKKKSKSCNLLTKKVQNFEIRVNLWLNGVITKKVPTQKLWLLARPDGDRGAENDIRFPRFGGHVLLEMLHLHVVQTVDRDQPTSSGWSVLVIQTGINEGNKKLIRLKYSNT